MKKVVLPNGLTAIFERKKGRSVVVEVMIKVGSNDEKPAERGVSHFVEHMVFEGTVKRPTNWDISNEIEKIGGEFNAYTTNERTCFYIKVLKKHFSKAIDVLADIIQNPLFKEEHINREKKVVTKEIDLVNDEPKFYQWILFLRHLFERHPCQYPTYGDKKVIKNLTREKLVAFFQGYYQPNNTALSIVGDIDNWQREIKEKFVFPRGPAVRPSYAREPEARKKKVKKEKRKVTNTYLVLGFKTVPRNHPDAYVLEVINGILGRGQSGRMFTEIRSNRGLAYDVGTQNVSEVNFGYLAVYATIGRKKVNLVRKVILEELEKLQEISPSDLQEAKNYEEGSYFLEMEDAQKVADQLLVWEQTKDARLMRSYIRKIKAVSPADIRRVTKKYLQNYTLVVLGA